jgi:hypothetical protein
MPSPFPGMNPYLEAAHWAGVHHWLITELAIALYSQLSPDYYAAVEVRIYEMTDFEAGLLSTPDPGPQPAPIHPAQSSAVTAPIAVLLPTLQTFREGYLEVRKVVTHQVITVIELLSPPNKQPGKGRSQYAQKRQDILASQTHLVEIDLLRKGKSMAFSSAATPTHYRILVSQSQRRPRADLYGFNLQEMIPTFPLPLTGEDAEPMINLKTYLDNLYDLGRYELQIDYVQEPPQPKLADADRQWCNSILQQNAPS